MGDARHAKHTGVMQGGREGGERHPWRHQLYDLSPLLTSPEGKEDGRRKEGRKEGGK